MIPRGDLRRQDKQEKRARSHKTLFHNSAIKRDGRHDEGKWEDVMGKYLFSRRGGGGGRQGAWSFRVRTSTRLYMIYHTYTFVHSIACTSAFRRSRRPGRSWHSLEQTKKNKSRLFGNWPICNMLMADIFIIFFFPKKLSNCHLLFQTLFNCSLRPCYSYLCASNDVLDPERTNSDISGLAMAECETKQ